MGFARQESRVIIVDREGYIDVGVKVKEEIAKLIINKIRGILVGG